MSQQAKIKITAQDQASSVIANIQNRLSGLGQSVTAIKWLEFGKLAGKALKDIGEMAGKAGGTAGDAFTELQNVFAGVQAKIGGVVLGNKELINGIKNVVAALVPLITTLLNTLVPVLTTVITQLMRVYEAFRPTLELVLSYAIPTFQKLSTILKIAGNGFLILKAAMTGNREEVKRLQEENRELSRSLTRFEPVKVSLKSADPAELAAIGAKIREDVGKGVKKKDKETDPKKEMANLFDGLLSLKEADKASAEELTKLNSLYEHYKSVVDDATQSVDDRAAALAKVAKFDNEVAARARAAADALKEQDAAIQRNIDKHNKRIDALIQLKKLGRATDVDIEELRIEQANITDLLGGGNLSTEERASLETRFAELTELFKVESEKFEQVVFDFAGVISDGFAAMFSGDGLLGGIQNFFSNAINEVGNGFRAFTMQWMKKQAEFILFQQRIYAFYGKLMASLSKFLGNPFTAGAAALGIAAGLSALSRRLGGGGGATGGVSSSTFSDRQRDIALNGQGDSTIYIQGGILDTSNTEQMRALANAIQSLSGRRVRLAGV